MMSAIRWLLPHPLLTLLLAVVWTLLQNQVSAGMVVFGIILGIIIPLITAAWWPDRPRGIRMGRMISYSLIVMWDILVANVTVARLILGRQERLEPAFLTLPLRLETDVAISVLANTISLTPGTVSTYLSADRRCLIIHSLHATDPLEMLETIRHRYETPLKEILETC